MKEFSLKNLSAIETRKNLLEHLSALSDEELGDFCEKLHLVGDNSMIRQPPEAHSRSYLEEILVHSVQKRTSQIQLINEMPLYPNESLLWDENLVPNMNYIGEGPLALPKLNLQFLTFHDYLLRNFNLFRLEAWYYFLKWKQEEDGTGK